MQVPTNKPLPRFPGSERARVSARLPPMYFFLRKRAKNSPGHPTIRRPDTRQPTTYRTPHSQKFLHRLPSPELPTPKNTAFFSCPTVPFLLPARGFVRLFVRVCSRRNEKIPDFQHSIPPTPEQTGSRKFSGVRFTDPYETNAALPWFSCDVSRETSIRLARPKVHQTADHGLPTTDPHLVAPPSPPD
jgi:hypothetical protein